MKRHHTQTRHTDARKKLIVKLLSEKDEDKKLNPSQIARTAKCSRAYIYKIGNKLFANS